MQSQTKSPEHTKKYEPAYDELARWLNKIYPLVVAEIGETTSAKIIKEYCCVEKRNKLACKLLQSIKIHASEDSQTKQVGTDRDIFLSLINRHLLKKYFYSSGTQDKCN